MNVVTESAIQEATAVTSSFEMGDCVALFSVGVASGIVFVTGIFLVSLAINAFFDIIRK